MPFDIQLTTVAAIPTAVIRDRVAPERLSTFVPAACGEVWSFARAAGLPRPGRHVSLYREAGLVEVGVELVEAIAGNDRIRGSELPPGRVATTTHFGPYAGLAGAHAALRTWCRANGHPLSGICWEIYGHWDPSWNTDPSRIRTDIFHLLSQSP